jgi:hypothetical protein
MGYLSIAEDPFSPLVFRDDLEYILKFLFFCDLLPESFGQCIAILRGNQISEGDRLIVH